MKLRFLADVNPSTPIFDQVPGGDPITFMPLETVWADGRLDTSRSRPKAEVSNGYVRFVEGDILSPKVTPTFQAGRSALIEHLPSRVGAASTEVHVVRTKPDLADARFVRYGLLTKPFLDGGVSRFQGVAGLQRVPDEYLREVPLRLASPFEQRQIADFLDDQVARIDNVIASRRQQVGLVTSMRASRLDQLLDDSGAPLVRLALLASVQSGITVDAGRDSDGVEVPYLRVANVQSGALDLHEIRVS